MSVGIVDYATGNIASLRNALKAIGETDVRFLINKADYENVDTVILPGVGAFAPAISRLKQSGAATLLKKHIISGKKLIGICLGLQLLFDESHENGLHKGLGLLSGSVEKLSESKNKFEKIPSVGWYSTNFVNNINYKYFENQKFYFVHSYHVVPKDPDIILATYNRNDQKIVATIRSDNIYGFQFHPEKSGPKGLKLLKKILW